jgi:predicted nucleic acid-binding protein
VKTFFDSSSLAKRYIDEQGSEAVGDLCMGASELGISVICVPEIISALNRRLREGSILPGDYTAAKQYLSDDVRDAMVINLTSPVVSACIAILESNPIRAMDALHVACALEWKAELFVSSDIRQILAAKKVGLQVEQI